MTEQMHLANTSSSVEGAFSPLTLSTSHHIVIGMKW